MILQVGNIHPWSCILWLNFTSSVRKTALFSNSLQYYTYKVQSLLQRLDFLQGLQFGLRSLWWSWVIRDLNLSENFRFRSILFLFYLLKNLKRCSLIGSLIHSIQPSHFMILLPSVKWTKNKMWFRHYIFYYAAKYSSKCMEQRALAPIRNPEVRQMTVVFGLKVCSWWYGLTSIWEMSSKPLQ